MYDAPTSAVIRFLNHSLPILNPIPSSLAKNEANWSNREITPRDSVEDTLAMLDVFIVDAVNFQNFKIRQFSAYVNPFNEARSLRCFL
jgi:hypothetical protein